jgi:signal transduction histidine kinase
MLEARREPDGFVRLAVHDTGIGIAPEQMDRLFQDFSQAGVPGERRYGAQAWDSRLVGGSPG